MTRDDIIRMARECGLPDWEPVGEKIERFAAIVAAAEREAIAQMIEDAPPLVEFSQNDKGGCMVCGFTPKLASAAIRARGKK
jgi:hypothetical protein